MQARQQAPEASAEPATPGVLVIQARKLRPDDELTKIFGKKFISSASREDDEGGFLLHPALYCQCATGSHALAGVQEQVV